jgi:hypothetical protein
MNPVTTFPMIPGVVAIVLDTAMTHSASSDAMSRMFTEYLHEIKNISIRDMDCERERESERYFGRFVSPTH